jgi:alpha-D-ribose 1-methylphosphonate 5-triphosphate diphosphatase PhnM
MQEQRARTLKTRSVQTLAAMAGCLKGTVTSLLATHDHPAAPTEDESAHSRASVAEFEPSEAEQAAVEGLLSKSAGHCQLLGLPALVPKVRMLFVCSCFTGHR